jgi:hypothetical protein
MHFTSICTSLKCRSSFYVDNDDDNDNGGNNGDKYYKQEKVSRRRLCQIYDKTEGHIISACPILVKEQYIKRHDTVCAVLHCNVCKETGAKLDSEHWYDRVPKLVERSHEGKVIVLWNQQV